MNIQLPLPLEAAPVELTTDDVRRMLLELARRHRMKARHFRAAADDTDSPSLRLTLSLIARDHEAKARHYSAAAKDMAAAIRIDVQ